MNKVDQALKPFVYPAFLALIMAVLHVCGILGLLGQGEVWANQPRTFENLSGIFLFHFRHSSWSHWGSNAVALIFLAGLAHMLVPQAARRAWIWLFLLSGVLLWIWGRPGGHIGASALTYGWFYFLLGMGIWRRDRAAIAGMLAALFLFGSMFWVFLAPAGVSWEGHVAGAVAGLLAAWTHRRTDPMPKPIFSDEDDAQPEVENQPHSLFVTRSNRDL